MTSFVIQNVNEAESFFATGGTDQDLISNQIDPSEPQVQGLTSYTDPLIADQALPVRLSNFDPAIWNMLPTSHLVRFLSALIGVAGAGGVRRAQLINRMTASMAGTNFLDLDGFWGALFGASRMSDEALPTIDGETIDPSNTALDQDTWDSVRSRDAKLRSRIVALAKGFAQGATPLGVQMAAEAILGCEVDITESWVLVDTAPSGTNASTWNPNTYFQVASKYTTYGNMRGVAWGDLQGGVVIPGNTPLGNRGEVTLTPKRTISEEERMQVAHVLSYLAPVGIVLTVLNTPNVSEREVPPRFVVADSTDWGVSSSVTQYQGITITDFDDVIYPNQATTAARPAFGEYAGERWSYNSRVAAISAYQMVNNQRSSPDVDAETILYADGTAQQYAPDMALLDPKQATLTHSAAEGILTSYPFVPGRFG